MNGMYPRLVVAALRGGSGKTIFSIGLCSLWRKRGREIVSFKKGPDYIDAAWLGRAAGSPCHHLDPYLMSWDQILGSFLRHTQKAHGAVVEGNRGLYDGVDPEGTYSTAELAKVLHAPVVVILDATKTTRTAAAMILGLRRLDPEVKIQAVVLNLVGGARHESILRRVIEGYADVKVLGAIPRLEGIPFPERHLGLVPPQEHSLQEEVIQRTTEAVEKYTDVDGLWEIAHGAGGLTPVHLYKGKSSREPGTPFRIGVIKDEAFHFYYPENLEALEERGAEIVPFSALETSHLPEIDTLYIGGGFPEMYAEGLAQNASLRHQIRDAVEEDLPVYAECGGLMYLGKALRIRGREYPMVGALPLATEFLDRPQGHGYTQLETMAENPFFPVDTWLRGHEFHYSRILSLEDSQVRFAFRVHRGNGVDGRREGIVRRNVLATYTHLHAMGCDAWGDGVAHRARLRRRERQPDLVMGSGLH